MINEAAVDVDAVFNYLLESEQFPMAWKLVSPDQAVQGTCFEMNRYRLHCCTPMLVCIERRVDEFDSSSRRYHTMSQLTRTMLKEKTPVSSGVMKMLDFFVFSAKS